MSDLRCSRCQEMKSPDEFYVHKTRNGGATGRQAYCKPCTSERAREYRSNPENRARLLAKQKEHYRANRERLIGDYLRYRDDNREKVAEQQRRSILKRKYGLTPEQYDEMCEKQQHLCSICCVKPEKLFIDHDHATGVVRGLLCSDCNTGLGMFRDNPMSLLRAADYLYLGPNSTTPVLGTKIGVAN